MGRKFFAVVLTLLLLMSLITGLTACKKDENKPVANDDEYTLTLKGMVDADGQTLADTAITKKQIKELYKTKPVDYTADNPCYASDKTDDNGNKIPHTLKGVYLEDLIAEYSAGSTIDAYGSLTLNAADNYVTIATEEIFNSAGRGSKMIIAFEYDGNMLSEKEKSGALRAVFPDQIANVWCKKLKSIEFSTDILQAPSVNKFTVLEALGEGYNGSYTIPVTTPNETYNMTYYGLSLKKLLDARILNAAETDKMYLNAWDYNDATEKYSEYSVWTKYAVFSNGYLLYEEQRGNEQREPMSRAPVFDGPAFEKGMTVKNVLALSVYKTAVVSLTTAMTRFDPDKDNQTDGKFNASDLLRLLNMWDDDNTYAVTPVEGNKVTLSYALMQAAKISKSGDSFILTYGNNQSVTVKSLEIQIA